MDIFYLEKHCKKISEEQIYDELMLDLFGYWSDKGVSIYESDEQFIDAGALEYIKVLRVEGRLNYLNDDEYSELVQVVSAGLGIEEKCINRDNCQAVEGVNVSCNSDTGRLDDNKCSNRVNSEFETTRLIYKLQRFDNKGNKIEGEYDHFDRECQVYKHVIPYDSQSWVKRETGTKGLGFDQYQMIFPSEWVNPSMFIRGEDIPITVIYKRDYTRIGFHNQFFNPEVNLMDQIRDGIRILIQSGFITPPKDNESETVSELVEFLQRKRFLDCKRDEVCFDSDEDNNFIANPIQYKKSKYSPDYEVKVYANGQIKKKKGTLIEYPKYKGVIALIRHEIKDENSNGKKIPIETFDCNLHYLVNRDHDWNKRMKRRFRSINKIAEKKGLTGRVNPDKWRYFLMSADDIYEAENWQEIDHYQSELFESMTAEELECMHLSNEEIAERAKHKSADRAKRENNLILFISALMAKREKEKELSELIKILLLRLSILSRQASITGYGRPVIEALGGMSGMSYDERPPPLLVA